MSKLNNRIRENKSLTLHTKMKLFLAPSPVVARPGLQYIADVYDRKCLRKILSIMWKNKVSNRKAKSATVFAILTKPPLALAWPCPQYGQSPRRLYSESGQWMYSSEILEGYVLCSISVSKFNTKLKVTTLRVRSDWFVLHEQKWKITGTEHCDSCQAWIYNTSPTKSS